KIVVPQGASVKVGGTIAVVGEPGEKAPAEDAAPAEEKKEPKKEEKKEAPAKKEAKAEEPKPPAKKQEAPAPAPEPKPARKEGERIFASPLARKMAEEHGLDIAAVEGTGPNGRVTKRDIEQAIEKGVKPAAKSAAKAAPAAQDTEVSLSQMRKAIARRLVQSRQEVPSFNLSADINADALLNAVARIKE